MCVTYTRRRVWLKYSSAGLSRPDIWIFGAKRNAIDESKLGVDDLVEGGFSDKKEIENIKEIQKKLKEQESKNRGVLKFSREEMEVYLSKYDGQSFDAKEYQIAYEKLLNHHKYVEEYFNWRMKALDEQKELLLKVSTELENTLKLSIDNAYNILDKSNNININEEIKLKEIENILLKLNEGEDDNDDNIYNNISNNISNIINIQQQEDEIKKQDENNKNIKLDNLNENNNNKLSLDEQILQLKRLSETFVTTTDEDEKHRILELYNTVVNNLQKQNKTSNRNDAVIQTEIQIKKSEELKTIHIEKQELEIKKNEQNERIKENEAMLIFKIKEENTIDRIKDNDDILCNVNDLLLEDRIERENLYKKQKNELDTLLMNNNNINIDDDKNKLLLKHNMQLEQLNEQINSERDLQISKMQEQLQKRTLKKNKLKQEENNKKFEIQEGEVQQLTNQLLKRRDDEIHLRHENEKQLITNEFNTLEYTEIEKLEIKLNEKNIKLSEELQKDVQKKILLLDPKLLSSEEIENEKNHLNCELNRRLNELDEVLQDEKNKQIYKIKHTLEQRNMRRNEAIKLKHNKEKELNKVESDGIKEEEQLRHKHYKEKTELIENHCVEVSSIKSEADFNIQTKLGIIQSKTDEKLSLLKNKLGLLSNDDDIIIKKQMEELCEKDKENRKLLMDEYEISLNGSLDKISKKHEKELKELNIRHNDEWNQLKKKIENNENILREKTNNAQMNDLHTVQKNSEETLLWQIERELKEKENEQNSQSEIEKRRARDDSNEELKKKLIGVTNLNDRKKIIDEHNITINRMEELLDEERLKQSIQLKKRIQQKKDKKLNLLKSKHEAEQNSLLIKLEQDNKIKLLNIQHEKQKRINDEIITKEIQDELLYETYLNNDRDTGGNKIRNALETISPIIDNQRKKYINNEEMILINEEAEKEGLIAAWRCNVARQNDEEEIELLKQRKNMKNNLKERRLRLKENQSEEKKELTVEHAFKRVPIQDILEKKRLEEQLYSNEDYDNIKNNGNKVNMLATIGVTETIKEELKIKQEEDIENLKKQFEIERDKLEQDMSKQLHTEQQMMENARKRKEHELEAARTRLQIDLNVKTSDTTDDYHKRQLLVEHEQRVEQLELDNKREFEEQSQRLQTKLEERRRKMKAKKDQLLSGQSEKMSQKVIEIEREQQEQLAKVQRDSEVKEAVDELGKLQTQAASVGVFSSNDEKRKLKKDTEIAFNKLGAQLDTRHASETENRVALQYTEKAQRLRLTMVSAQRERAEKQAEAEAEIMKLKDITDEQKTSRLMAYESKFDLMVDEKMEEVRSRLNREHSEELITLRERQLDEIIQQISDFIARSDRQATESGTCTLSAECRLNGDAMIEAAKEEKRNIIGIRSQKRAEVSEKIKAIQEEMRRKEEELKEQLLSQQKEIENKMFIERQEARANADAIMREKREERRKKKQCEHNIHLEKVLAGMTGEGESGDDHRKTVLDIHAVELIKLEQSLDIERSRQLAKMDNRLKERLRAREKIIMDSKMKLLQEEQIGLRREQEKLLEQENNIKMKQKKAVDNIRLSTGKVTGSRLKGWRKSAKASVATRKASASKLLEEVSEDEGDGIKKDGEVSQATRQQAQRKEVIQMSRRITRMEGVLDSLLDTKDLASLLITDTRPQPGSIAAAIGMTRAPIQPEERLAEISEAIQQAGNFVHLVKLAAETDTH
eukprot:GHVR01120594.1.p1 GENE.GHVR01120594.1~~GHVR01120594.1.p1  ORF type:complete len:1953 (+),score=683.22 GHVR01120594.1:734-5860(+)